MNIGDISILSGWKFLNDIIFAPVITKLIEIPARVWKGLLTGFVLGVGAFYGWISVID